MLAAGFHLVLFAVGAFLVPASEAHAPADGDALSRSVPAGVMEAPPEPTFALPDLDGPRGPRTGPGGRSRGPTPFRLDRRDRSGRPGGAGAATLGPSGPHPGEAPRSPALVRGVAAHRPDVSGSDAFRTDTPPPRA